MAGARGFNDPNVPIDPETNTTLFAQPVNANQSDVPTLLPWYLGYLGGNTTDAIQCMSAGSNAYEENQAALNHDKNDQWVTLNTPYSWGYYTRNELPVQFGIAEGWTVGDMYQVPSPVPPLSVFSCSRWLPPGIFDHRYLPEPRHSRLRFHQRAWRSAAPRPRRCLSRQQRDSRL